MEFIKKYGAVPANDRGIEWRRMTDDQLCQMFAPLVAICKNGWNAEAQRDATEAEIRGNRPLYDAVCAEIIRRAKLPNPSGEIFAASMRLTW